MWLCPKCESRNNSCRICDGSGFLSDMEFQHYENSQPKKPTRSHHKGMNSIYSKSNQTKASVSHDDEG